MRTSLLSNRAHKMLWLLVLVAGANSLHAGESAPSPETPAAFSTLPSESILLLGEHSVASTHNLKQRFFPADKHQPNPIFTRGEPWEGVGPYLWGSRLMQDEKSRELRMWYIAYRHEDNHYRWGYATSTDGLHWTRPDLRVESFAGHPTRNCLPLGPHPEKGARSIARDPRPETPPERRYLGVRFTYDGEFVSFSPDGIHWHEHPENPVWHVPSDIIHVMWDDQRQKFIAYYKVWELSGREVRLDNQGSRTRADGVPFIAHMPTFTLKDLGNGTTEFTGPCITFNPPGAATVEERTFVLRSGNQSPDDGGGTSLSGEWNAKRVQAFAESSDGLQWTNEQIVLRADEDDHPTANMQYLFVIQYGGYYLGFITMHDDAGYFRIQLAWSDDGLRWHRSSRAPWLDVGRDGQFDSGMVLGPADPILQPTEMWFPYGGFPIRHDTKETNWQSAIGLATTRLDGFAAWQAANKPGELITQPFTFNGNRLFLNADARGGEITVEVLDGNGQTITGLEATSCVPITTDTLEERGESEVGWVRWKSTASPANLHNQTVQLKVHLQNARLYSFRVADEGAKKLFTPRTTTH